VGESAPIRLAELVGALALATDLASGQPLEHGLRTAVLAVRLGELAGASEEDRADAFYVGLLHSAGCTSDAHELAMVYGDDIAPRAAFSRVDAGRPAEVLRFLLDQVGAGAPVLRRGALLAAALAEGPRRPRRTLAVHCEVAQRFADRLGLGAGVRRALGYVFERWDGKGFPAGAAGDSIPLPARLLHVARDGSIFGADGIGTVTSRAGGAYDPGLARLAPQALSGLDELPVWQACLDAEPGQHRELDAESLDGACEALADLVDLKSPWWLGHSRAVADLAEAAAWRLRLPAGEVAQVRRAALVHDLGRAGVSNAIWERPGPLRLGEWEQVRLHPHFTERAFASSRLARLGELAAMHHERLDGSGYHRRLPESAQPETARIVAAADAYQAMTEERPYRRALDPARAADELRADARAGRLDSDVVECVLAAAGHRADAPARRLPDDLTEREVEILRLAARGNTNRVIAELLHLSPKTVGHHLESVYRKAGVSSRAAAALYAVEKGLLAA